LTQILHIDARDTNIMCSYLFDIISLEKQMLLYESVSREFESLQARQ